MGPSLTPVPSPVPSPISILFSNPTPNPNPGLNPNPNVEPNPNPNPNLPQTVIGTLPYMAPEIWAGKPYTYTADIYSLGCTFFELAALNPPFNGGR